MSNDLDIKNQNPLIVPPEANVQVGNNNLQIGHVDSVNHSTMVIAPIHPIGVTEKNMQQSVSMKLRTDMYHLFVCPDALCERFVIPYDRALTESISKPVKDKYARLDEPAIKELLLLPAIFATENNLYGKTDDQHLACFGSVSEIIIQDNGIKICARYFFTIPQQRLNEIQQKLAIEKASGYNELNRAHWTIKRIDLVEVLRDEGLMPFG